MRMTAVAALALLLAAAPLAAEDPGAALYQSKCAACHGKTGASDTPVAKTMKAPELRSADVQKKTDEQLAAAIGAGKGKMPAFSKSLTAAQIQTVVAHVRTFTKK